MEQWTDRNQEFTPGTNRKQDGPQSNFEEPSNNYYFSNLFLLYPRRKWQWRKLMDGASEKFKNY
jgi:hypothetical protein